MGKILVTSWTIPGSDGQPIYGNTHFFAPSPMVEPWAPTGVLICCHGFKGYKDYGFLPLLCDQAAKQGLIAHRFNFSHSGMTNNIETFERPELFEKDTWGRQVDDLLAVNRDWAGKEVFADLHRQSAGLPTVIFGHSRGGVTSLLYAARTYKQTFYRRSENDRWSDPPAGVVTAAAPDYACNLDDLVKDQLRAEGRLLSPSGRTGQDLYVGLDWLEEIQRQPELYDPQLAAAYVKCPMLILHGDADETVPIDCARNLHQAATPNSQLEIISGANHVFNCPNPVPSDLSYAQLPDQTRRMIDRSIAFATSCCQT